jgi:urease subunit beta
MSGTSSNGPGAIKVAPGDLELNADRGPSERGELTFTNVADRPIQIGSHIHLPDVNPGLEFDRSAAQGFRLDIASGTSVRFEPGVSRTVGIVALRGLRRVPGIQLRGQAVGGTKTVGGEA